MFTEEETLKTKDGRELVLRCGEKEDAQVMMDGFIAVCGESDNLSRGSEEAGQGMTLDGEEAFIQSGLDDPRSVTLLAFVDGEYAGNGSFNPAMPFSRMAHRCVLGLALLLFFVAVLLVIAATYILFISVMVLIFSSSFWTMVFALTITGWLGIAYFIRTQVIIIRDREYNLASRCLGTSIFTIAMKNILPFMTSVIVTLAATEIPSYISYEVFLSYIGMGLSDMSLGKLIFNAESAMVTPGWEFEFWSPVVIASIITVVLYVVGQNLGDASDPRTHM